MTGASAVATWWLAAQLLAALPADTVPAPAADSDTTWSPRPGQQVPFDATRFDTLTANALRSLLDSAAARGLPTGPLINRALEGSARRASGPLILQVVRAYAASLAEAKEALGNRSTIQELDAGAGAIGAGIDPGVLAAIRLTRPPGQALTPLVVMTDLVRRGVPSLTARDAVTSIARMPTSDEALLGLQTIVAKNAPRGPGMALQALNRYVTSTVPGARPPSTPVTPDRKPTRPPPS